MIESRSGTDLILTRAVAGANVDIATQEIVRMANDADPTHSRTLGVFTKPDLVDDGAEPKVGFRLLHICDIADNDD